MPARRGASSQSPRGDDLSRNSAPGLNRGELLLAHRHEGMDLRIGYARDTLENLEDGCKTVLDRDFLPK